MGASHSPSTPAKDSHGGHASHENTSDPAYIAAHIGAYMKVGALLLVLTGVTVGLSYVDFGSRSMNILVGMIVATVKASMVAAIFMHLKGEKMTIWRFLIMTGVFAVGLFFLTFLAHSDPISGTSHSTH
jgi:cytochrome c oxidase subunit 4